MRNKLLKPALLLLLLLCLLGYVGRIPGGWGALGHPVTWIIIVCLLAVSRPGRHERGRRSAHRDATHPAPEEDARLEKLLAGLERMETRVSNLEVILNDRTAPTGSDAGEPRKEGQ